MPTPDRTRRLELVDRLGDLATAVRFGRVDVDDVERALAGLVIPPRPPLAGGHSAGLGRLSRHAPDERT
ncbi:MAG: hypothetical protein L0227_09815 [Chloroflexi bacterium]|nr:hypothetical protein [Chloroflexota bacterium]